jgi:hypothetical protein
MYWGASFFNRGAQFVRSPFLSNDLSDAHEFGRNFKFTRLIQGVHHDRSLRQLVMNLAARLNSIGEGHLKI